MTAQELQEKLHREIPLSRFMQVQVVKLDEAGVELECALEPNHNHLGTAFGGSLSCLMILAAYCQIFRLIDSSGHVVIKSGELNYKIPVNQKLRAVCPPPSLEEIQNFTEAYRKKGKARLTLESSIVLDDGRVACTLQSEFVGIT